MAASKHDWHALDVDRGLEVRQTTGAWRANRWQVRTAAGRTADLDDAAFERLRSDPDWLPEELR